MSESLQPLLSSSAPLEAHPKTLAEEGAWRGAKGQGTPGLTPCPQPQTPQSSPANPPRVPLNPGAFAGSQAVLCSLLPVATPDFPVSPRPTHIPPPSGWSPVAAPLPPTTCTSCPLSLAVPPGPSPWSPVPALPFRGWVWARGQPRLLGPSIPCGETPALSGAHGAAGLGMVATGHRCPAVPQTGPPGGSASGDSRVPRQDHWPRTLSPRATRRLGA